MAVEAPDCFKNKTIDNQLYTILEKMVEKGYASDIPSRDCFNGLTLDNQLYLLYIALKRELWTPTQIPTVFWYDPSDAATITTSGATVTQVLDKSGNGYTLSVTTPGKTGPTIGTRTLNGLNVFEYALVEPNNQVLENDSFSYNQAATPLCLAMIVRCDDEGLTEADFIFSGTETVTPRIAFRRTTVSSLEILSASVLSTPLGVAPEDQTMLLLAKFNSTTSTIRKDGTQLAAGNIGTVPFSSMNIGASEGEAQAVEGYIAEIVSFADPTKQEIVEGYLAWKWGLQGSLPPTHPYKNFPPKV